MAIEAQHFNVFLAQLIGNREINAIESANICNTHMNLAVPLSETITGETLVPFHDSFPAKTTMKTGSCLTNNLSVPRKHTRDSINPFIKFPSVQKNHGNDHFSFLGEDISLQIIQQQLEIDRFIAQHTQKIRVEMAENRKGHSKRLLATVEEGIAKKLKSKEEEIEKIVNLNWVLEERAKNLCLENQIWRDIAQKNEAMANDLRGNLEHLLAQVKDECYPGAREDIAVAVMADEAESCCRGCNFGVEEEEEEEEEEKRILAENGRERKMVKDKSGNGNRWCRNCEKEESCVLLLPCRHLCLCKLCGSTLHTCPICNSTKIATVHVSMS